MVHKHRKKTKFRFNLMSYFIIESCYCLERRAQSVGNENKFYKYHCSCSCTETYVVITISSVQYVFKLEQTPR